ncbi:uncharacterized protein LOC113502821 [Trichoplusia ni]|uniref:Uncharacterized protein LOC113502821 n=1 Tax=Trichoplusia ni TaxID=7111 RepID=A0A7E5WI23_TRINI|nr:uncharacterized protein LOC113502821 [Trichoplusia ni]
MSDSSEDEDLSRFREVIDTSFTKLINESRGEPAQHKHETIKEKPKSERYLEESSHYNDVKVPEEMQRRIGLKISAILNKNIEFVDVKNEIKKRKIKGGVKLFKASEGFLSCEEVKDTYTESHNVKSKNLKKKRRQVDLEDQEINEDDKVKAVAVSGEYVMSKEETKIWKSRRKEKLFKYKPQKNSKVLIAVE